eukprot:403339189
MEIEEIKCPLCQELYDEHERMPILLPDCGHSYCLQCINQIFAQVHEEQQQFDQEHQIKVDAENEKQQSLIDEDESLNLQENDQDFLIDSMNKLSINNTAKTIKRDIALFRCPDDDIQKAEQLPKNYALLKFVQKTNESMKIKKNKVVKLDFKVDEGLFIVSRPEDNSLANFLTSGSPQKIIPTVSHQNSSDTQFSMQEVQIKEESFIQQQTITQQTTMDFEQPQSKISIPTLNMSQINSTPNIAELEPPQLENCKAHNRPAELICVDDQMRICAQCALFGHHKGHDVRMEEDVTKEISLKVEVIMEMYQAMENSCEELNNQENYDRHYNTLKAKQNEIKEKIQDKFKEWREAQGWMDKAKQQLDDYTNKTTLNPFYIPYEMIDNKRVNYAEDILLQGENLLEKTEREKGFPSLNGLDQSYGTVKVSFDPTVDKKLQNIAKVYCSNGQQQHDISEDFTTHSGSFLPPFSQYEEEDLNDGIQHVKLGLANDALNLSNISFNEPASPINTQQTINRPPPLNDFEEVKESRNSSNNNETISSSNNTTVLSNGTPSTSTNKSQLSQSKLRRFSTIKPPAQQQNALQHQSTQIQQKNSMNAVINSEPTSIPTPAAQHNSSSKKKNDLPTTFKNEIQHGELDLSNRNLSDMHSNDLAKCIRTLSGGVRLLNMQKNRISDEGILHIIKALCESQIEQVNLQANKLSEKCVEGIVGCLKTNKTLKVLDLSNNAITSRLMKNKLKNGLPQIDVIV